MPKASIVIPVHNGASFVGRAIESVLAQTEPDLELIVVDDGSVDDTGSVVAAFADPRLRCHRQRNAGPSAARNAGIELAQGEWIGFLDADDCWAPRKLAAHLCRAAARPDAGVIYSSVIVLGPTGEQIEVIPATAEGDVLEQLLFGNVIVGGGSSATVRREVFERVGPFDVSVKYGEDWEMWLRAATAYPFVVIDEPLTRRYSRHDSYGTATVAMREECLAFLNRAFDSYAAKYRAHRAKALAEVYYRAATTLHDEQVRGAACIDLLRTLQRNPRHPYAYRRLIRLAAGM